MRNNTYLPPEMQAETPSLMERARINLRRRAAEKAATASIQNRKSIENSASPVSDLERAPSVIVPSSSPISSPSSLSHTDMLKRIREARARYTPDQRYQRKQATIRKDRERAARRLPPRWDRLAEADKAPHYAHAILEGGSAVSVSILFSQRLLERAGKAKDGVFQLLRRRVTAALKAAVGVSVSHTLALDVSAAGAWHLHGFIDWPSGDLFALRDALKPAAGEWSHRSGQEHQIHLQSDQCELIGEDIFDASKPLTAGFGSYGAKHSKRLRSETNHSTLYASSDVKKHAEVIYTTIRNEQKQRKTSNRSINVDLQPKNTVETSIVSESQISTYHPVTHYGWGLTHDYADHLTRPLRRPVSGHAERHPLGRTAPDDDRSASGLRPTVVHSARRHEWRRRDDDPRSDCALCPPPRRADSARARGLGAGRSGLRDHDPHATGPP